MKCKVFCSTGPPTYTSMSRKSKSSKRSLTFKIDNLFKTNPNAPFSLFSHNKTTDLTKFSSCKNGSDKSRDPDTGGNLELNSINGVFYLHSHQDKTKYFLNAITMLILKKLRSKWTLLTSGRTIP